MWEIFSKKEKKERKPSGAHFLLFASEPRCILVIFLKFHHPVLGLGIKEATHASFIVMF